MGFKALSFWTHWGCQEIDSQALTTSLHWFVDGISCWTKLEQNILTTCKSLQANQTPPKPRQILISVPSSGCWATSWRNWPCHGFCCSSCQDLNSADFKCCSPGSDPRPVFTAWRVEAPILCSVWFYKWFYATWIWVKHGETGYDIQRCLRHNAKQGCRLILADRLQGRCCGTGLSFLKNYEAGAQRTINSVCWAIPTATVEKRVVRMHS